MTINARLFVLSLGGLVLLGGIAGLAAGVEAWPAVLFGALILIGTLFDLGYRGTAAKHAAAGAKWQLTGEREINTLTGEAQEVWFDPLTGTRRYEPLGADPNRG